KYFFIGLNLNKDQVIIVYIAFISFFYFYNNSGMIQNYYKTKKNSKKECKYGSSAYCDRMINRKTLPSKIYILIDDHLNICNHPMIIYQCSIIIQNISVEFRPDLFLTFKLKPKILNK
ncbi:hypothetical protein BpHYR1_044640, partial [Brachionus plicatilis]